MASGFRLDSGREKWLLDYEEAKHLAQEALQLIQDRNMGSAGGGSVAEASRKTATARRKMGTLGTLIEKLLQQLDSAEMQSLSESERNRRRDLLFDLRNRREQMQGSLKRNPGQSDREQLLSGSQQGGGGSKETEVTAELDTAGLMQMQHQVMRSQDATLDTMEKTVQNTKHIALAINDELGLQNRLLDELEEEVEVHESRVKAATAKVKKLIKDSSTWRGGLCVFLTIIIAVTLLLLFAKLSHLFFRG